MALVRLATESKGLQLVVPIQAVQSVKAIVRLLEVVVVAENSITVASPWELAIPSKAVARIVGIQLESMERAPPSTPTIGASTS
jgi:hypothetical protein